MDQDPLPLDALARRLDLQSVLEGILGSRNVYFQPPPDVVLQYPAIIYDYNRDDDSFANNALYRTIRSYTVTVIDRDPDSTIGDKIRRLPMCSRDRRFKADSLNHDVLRLYF